jgi:hypothetical protein
MEDVEIDLAPGDQRMEARVSVRGALVAELCVVDHSWQTVRHLYQSFMRESDENYLANIWMEGQQSEHEEESGYLRLHEHPFQGSLALPDVADVPFREVWMRDGMQTFEPLISFPA